MSREHLEAIVRRAINDSAFRELLTSDPDSALSGYDLSEEERELLANPQGADFNELLLNLEPRVSKGGGPPGGPMD